MGRNSVRIPKAEPSGRQLSWSLFFRVLIITLFLGGSIVYQLRSGLEKAPPVLPYLYLLVGISYLFALISASVLPRTRRLKLFTQAQIVWDLLFVFSLIYVTGGIESLFSFLFILVITSASVFLSRKEVLVVASASAILYGSLLDLQYYGYLPLIGGLTFPAQIDGRDIFYAVFVNVIAFFLTALLSGTLSERLRRSEIALERKAIDYAELENLNRTILANITSGLMIINPHGRIRSLNAAAEKITGYSLQEAYDRDVREVFSQLQIFDGTFKIVNRGEGRFVDQEGQLRILGYASSLIEGPREKILGLLVTFQDLTHVKELEEQLQRADRLAAIGKLASGMAHEIRNPLASISGSVQLLMEGSQVSEEDRRLMGIVVKEADRLSDLLTDFLLFARPTPPQFEPVDVSALLDELADMIACDSRFGGIDVRRAYPPSLTMSLDRHQFHQALWNLLINGAEALDGEGTLRIGLEPGAQAIYVEDSGPGIPPHIREKIFDPFFTTKDRGTGLGLATVYAIVEAHGGMIEVASGANRGTRFIIRLPRMAVNSGRI
jgi:two-component system sensor histidine kinase PilS (NtrC family)